MKRRSFLLTSGSAVLSGTAFSKLQRSAFGLDFELSTVPKRKPSSVDSVLVQFSKFKLTPRYVDSQKDAKIDIDVKIGSADPESVSKTVSVTNGDPVVSDDIRSELPISVEGITTSESSLNGEITIKVNHDSIGSETYSQQFKITDNPLLDGLIDYYPIDKDNGEIIHESIDSDLGQIIGASWNSSSQSGSSSIEFNGNGDEIVLSGEPYTPSGDGDISTSAWFRYDVSDNTDSTIYGQKDTGSNTSWRIVVDDSDNIAGVKKDGNGNFVTVTGDEINTGVWYHATITWDGSTFSLYLDGSFQGSKTVSGHDLKNDAHNIGSSGGFRYFGGLIEDVRVYNRVLSEDDIKDIMARRSPAGRLITEDDVLSNNNGGVSYWEFDDSSDTGTVIDSWGSNDGTIYDGANYIRGAYNSGLEFPTGTDAYVDIEEKVFQNNKDYTISLWWNEYNENGRGGVFQREPTADLTGARFGFHFGRGSSNGFSWYVQDKENEIAQVIYTDINNDINDWTHFAGVFNSTEKSVKLYRNGEIIGSDTNTNLDPSNLGVSDHYNTRIARRESSRWNGKLDDIRIYEGSLSEKEIRQIFRLGSYKV